MRCAACAQALTGGAEYRATCMGCQARAVARCDAMRRVMDGSLADADRLAARAELRQTIGRAMPHVTYEDARASVMQWWRVDEANRAGQDAA